MTMMGNATSEQVDRQDCLSLSLSQKLLEPE